VNIINKSLTQFLLTVLLIGILSPIVIAGTNTINYQGKLLDSSGTPVTGTVSMTFQIYIIGTSSAQWSSTRTVQVENGIYQLQLGEATSFGTLDFSQSLELGVTVEADNEMTPRQPLSSVAHAQNAFTADLATVATNATNADTLDSLDSTAFVLQGESGVISSDMIINGAITLADLGNNSVGSNQVADGSITNSDLSTASVKSANIVDATITAADLGDNSVGAGEIAAGAVGTSEIADGSVTAGDLADNYVNVSGDYMTGVLSVVNTITTGTAKVLSQAAYDTYGLLAIPQATNDFEVPSADWSGYEIGVAGISVGTSNTDNYGVLGHSNTVGVRGEYSEGPTTNYGELGKNGVGVFGKGSTWAGEFDGSVKAGNLEVTGEYRYSSTRSHYYQMPPSEFAGDRASDYCQWSEKGFICNGEVGVLLFAPVHLPKGSTITSVRAYYYDNDDTLGFAYIWCNLLRRTPISVTSDMLSHTSNATTDSFASDIVLQSTDSTIENSVVDENYQYYVEIYMQRTYSAMYIESTRDVNFRGVRIAYTMDTVSP